MSDEVLPCTGHVDNGCIANLVRGGCDLAGTAAIVADLGRAAVDSTAELVVGGKGGGGTTMGGGGGGADMEGRIIIVVVVDIDSDSGGVEGSG
jgi:hypothetical protein